MSVTDFDGYDPIHAAMLAAGQDWTASDLLWSGFSPIGFGATGGNDVPRGRRMSDDMPERIGKHRAFIAECNYWRAVRLLVPQISVEHSREAAERVCQWLS